MRSFLLCVVVFTVAATAFLVPDPVPFSQTIRKATVNVTIIHTTDVHGWLNGHPHDEAYNADFGDFLSLVQHLEERFSSNRDELGYLLLLDSGDLIEGTGLSDATPVHGEYIWPLVKQIPYSALTMGNHEIGVESAVDELQKNFVPHWNGRYLTANTKKADSSDFVGSPYFVHDSPDGQLRVLFLGYMFDFTHFASNVHVVEVSDSLEEAYFAEAMAVPDVDLYVVLGHIDIVMSETDQIREAVRAHHATTPIVFMSGHRHIKSYKQLDPNCVAIESWRYFKALGHLSLQLDTSASPNALNNRLQAVSHRWVDTSRDNFYELTGRNETNFLTPDGARLKQAIQDTNSMMGLDEVLGCSPRTYEPSVPLEWDTSLFTLLLTEMYPTVVYNTQAKKNKQLAILNTSSLRNPLYQGTVDRNDIYTVDPFNNVYGSVDDLAGSMVLQLLDFLNNQPRELVQWYSCGHEFAASGLPHFVFSPETVIEENTTYDIVCTSYDCITFTRALYDLTGVDYPRPTYPTQYTSTEALAAFMSQEHPCSAEPSQ